MDKIGKTFLGINIHIWCSFKEIFGILFSFHIILFSAVKVKMT